MTIITSESKSLQYSWEIFDFLKDFSNSTYAICGKRKDVFKKIVKNQYRESVYHLFKQIRLRVLCKLKIFNLNAKFHFNHNFFSLSDIRRPIFRL